RSGGSRRGTGSRRWKWTRFFLPSVYRKEIHWRCAKCPRSRSPKPPPGWASIRSSFAWDCGRASSPSARPSRCRAAGGRTTSILFALSVTCRGWTWEVETRMHAERTRRLDPMAVAAAAEARERRPRHRNDELFREWLAQQRRRRRELYRETWGGDTLQYVSRPDYGAVQRRRSPFEWYRDDAWRRRIRGA